MARKITKLGHAVKGALAAYIAPRLAADAAFKPGELSKLLLAIDHKLSFKKQIPLIADSAKKTFKDRLAQDADMEDLAELLEALSGEDVDDDMEAGEDAGAVPPKKPKEGAADEDDMGSVAEDEDEEGPGEKLMKIISGLDIPASELETINGLITELSKPAAADAFPPKKPDAAAPKKPENNAPGKEVPSMKPAMDRKTVDEIIQTAVLADRKNTKAHLASLYAAAEEVKPFIGDINVLACDSAEHIYQLALDAHGIPTKDVHPSAFKSLLPLITAKAAAARPAVAMDAAAVTDFSKRFTHIPDRA